MTVALDVTLSHGERISKRDAELFPYQVYARYHLGDGMFNLNTAVHFQEIEFVAVFVY